MAYTTDPIYPILRTRLQTFITANSYTLLEPGVTVAPSQTALHFRQHFLPADVGNRTLASGYIGRERGIFQVEAWAPEAWREGGSRNLGWAIRNHFFPEDHGINLSSGNVTVRITKPPTVKKTVHVDGYLMTQVDIVYFCDLFASS